VSRADEDPQRIRNACAFVSTPASFKQRKVPPRNTLRISRPPVSFADEVPRMSSKFDPKKPVPTHQAPGSSTTLDKNKTVAHVVTPEGAVQVFRAAGEFGDKVAVAGFSVSNFGVFASSEQGVGLSATGPVAAAAFEGNVTISGACDVAGNIHMKGNLVVAGDIQLSGADYAEDFDVSDCAGAEPGSVMVLDNTGGLRVSDLAYDPRVAGVVSGAGGCKPAVILDRHDVDTDRRPLALMGKVYCWVDASTDAVEVGDLLTTSSTPGHAMKAANRSRAFGAVIGKALRPLPAGRGLVPILVALQ